MAKPYTPDLDPEALARLDAYAARFRDAFALDRPARWCPVYLRGLITDGERKSIEPLSRRVPLPPELAVKDPRAGPPTIRQPEPLGRAGGLAALPRRHGRGVRRPGRHL